MKEYIEREATIDGLREHLRYMLDGAPISVGTKEIYEMAYRHCIDKINSIPAADLLPVVRGNWKKRKGWSRCVCSACSYENKSETNFCPNCGAEMREVDNGNK